VPDRSLLPRPWRPVAALVWIAAAATLGVLAWHFAHAPAVDAPDAAVGSRLTDRLAPHARLFTTAARLGSPAAVAGGAVFLALTCLAVRRVRGAVFALVAAPVAGLTTEAVLKPLVHRQTHLDALMFPSGHTTGAFALALTVVVLVLPRPDTSLLPAFGRLLLAVAALAGASVVAIAVVVLGWHYVTDTIGGAATAVVVVVGIAALVDAFAPRNTKKDAAATRPAGSPPRVYNAPW
jgi:undecaprenyl-diphosphatase